VSPRAGVATSEPAHCGVPDGSLGGVHAAAIAGTSPPRNVSREPVGTGVSVRLSESHFTGSGAQAERRRQTRRTERCMSENSRR
jgi:hypothetical protein